MPNLTIKNDLTQYLEATEYIDWTTPAIIDKSNEFKNMAQDEIHLVKMLYEYVRDEIKHSWDAQEKELLKRHRKYLNKKLEYAGQNLICLRHC